MLRSEARSRSRDSESKKAVLPRSLIASGDNFDFRLLPDALRSAFEEIHKYELG